MTKNCFNQKFKLDSSESHFFIYAELDKKEPIVSKYIH